MEPEFYQQYFAEEQGHWWFKMRRRLIFSLLKQYLTSSPAQTKLLDYGCGSGYLVGQLQRAGYDAYGQDISPEAIAFGQQRGIKRLAAAKGSRINFSDNYFDLVLALDVVEHIADDRAALAELARVLRPAGIAIITVPAYQWLWGKQDVVARHYRRYRLQQLIRLVERNTNLRPLKKSYFNTLLFPGVIIFRLLDKLFPIQRQSDFDLNNRLLNRLLYGIFRQEIPWLKHFSFPFGLSILLVLKKYE